MPAKRRRRKKGAAWKRLPLTISRCLCIKNDDYYKEEFLWKK